MISTKIKKKNVFGSLYFLSRFYSKMLKSKILDNITNEQKKKSDMIAFLFQNVFVYGFQQERCLGSPHSGSSETSLKRGGKNWSSGKFIL